MMLVDMQVYLSSIDHELKNIMSDKIISMYEMRNVNMQFIVVLAYKF